MVQIWDPFDEQHISDPFPIYRRLRDEHPVYHNEDRDFFALTRYKDVVAANADWHTFSSAEGVDLDNSGALLFGAGNFVEEDPPLHDQLRAVNPRAPDTQARQRSRARNRREDRATGQRARRAG